MRYFILFFAATLLTIPAMAQTKINDEMTKAYYDSCMGQRDQRMSRESQDDLCGCTSVKMQETMSVEDVRAMGQENQAGRNMLNKMLLDVYVPCMGTPLTEMVRDECMMGGEMNVKGIHKQDLCACMAEKTATWFTTNGRDLMTKVLAESPNITDPLSPVMNSPDFNDTAYSNMKACMPGRKK